MRWGNAGKMAVAGGLIALCGALAAPAGAGVGGMVPFERHGTLTMTVPGSFEPIRSEYKGPFPDMKRREFVGYTIWQSDPQGTQPDDCNDGANLDGSPDVRKPRKGTWEVFVDQDNPFVSPGAWCPGEWRAIATVFKKNRDGFYLPRLQFAKKKFQVG